MDDKKLDRLDSLIKNGFDFLERAIRQLKTEPKYSVINFCAAIEILLKARLMHEHWSLVMEGDPDVKKFQSGDFKSINFKDLLPRIQAVTGEKISDETSKSFEGLANHRNKMVHFFHEVQGSARNEKMVEKIAIEQFIGWFFLGQLLESWEDIFGEYQSRYQSSIEAINLEMRKHEEYFHIVYKRIEPKLNRAKDNGAIFVECKRCKEESSEQFKRTEIIYEYKCRVCHHENGMVRLPYSHKSCKGMIEIDEGDSTFYCSICKEKIDPSYISDYFDEKLPVDKKSYSAINCVHRFECLGERGSGVEDENGYYVCKKCFYFTNTDVGECVLCGEYQMGGGDLEEGYFFGCVSCGGLER